MRVRALNSDGDWTFGQGKNDYLNANLAVMQDIQTRVSSFIGNCFFDMAAGIDWFNLLSQKDQTSLNLAISNVIINTPNVTGLQQLSVILNDNTRVFSVTYQVQTTYSITGSSFQYDFS